MTKHKRGNSRRKEMKIILLLLCIVFLTTIAVTYFEYSNRILPCWEYDYPVPIRRLAELPERFEVKIKSDNDIILCALDVTGERVCKYSYSSDDTRIAISPDGLHIAFQARIRYPSSIIVMSINGDDGFDLTAELRYPSGSLIWSPDSQQLVFNEQCVIALSTNAIECEDTGRSR